MTEYHVPFCDDRWNEIIPNLFVGGMWCQPKNGEPGTWGDVYVRDGLAVEVAEVAPTLRDLLRGIKQQVMGAREQPAPDRLMPQEDAAHFDEMVDVHQHRAVLALPGEPRAHAQAHLAIAKAYTAIATKERGP